MSSKPGGGFADHVAASARSPGNPMLRARVRSVSFDAAPHPHPAVGLGVRHRVSSRLVAVLATSALGVVWVGASAVDASARECGRTKVIDGPGCACRCCEGRSAAASRAMSFVTTSSRRGISRPLHTRGGARNRARGSSPASRGDRPCAYGLGRAFSATARGIADAGPTSRGARGGRRTRCRRHFACGRPRRKVAVPARATIDEMDVPMEVTLTEPEIAGSSERASGAVHLRESRRRRGAPRDDVLRRRPAQAPRAVHGARRVLPRTPPECYAAHVGDPRLLSARNAH